LHIERNFSIDDVSGMYTYGRDSLSFNKGGIGKIMLDHPEGVLAGSLMLESKIAGSGGSLDWNVRAQSKSLLVFVGFNVSDKHNMIKLLKVNDKYQGDLQLIPLLGNIQAHIDGRLNVVSSSKW
jgi:hypothetical protein